MMDDMQTKEWLETRPAEDLLDLSRLLRTYAAEQTADLQTKYDTALEWLRRAGEVQQQLREKVVGLEARSTSHEPECDLDQTVCEEYDPPRDLKPDDYFVCGDCGHVKGCHQVDE